MLRVLELLVALGRAGSTAEVVDRDRRIAALGKPKRELLVKPVETADIGKDHDADRRLVVGRRKKRREAVAVVSLELDVVVRDGGPGDPRDRRLGVGVEAHRCATLPLGLRTADETGDHGRDPAPRRPERLLEIAIRSLEDALAVTAQDRFRMNVAEAFARRDRTEDRMDAEALAGRDEVADRPECVGDHEHAARRPPERDLLPRPAFSDDEELERRGRRHAPGVF